ncbi:MAG TPA: VanW family protein [Patescibacteria group bacterium]|nr:VanW family protein [bacterium]HRT11337.1 VanW family protein [Patescibacteria group bacterium]HRU90184.1 VanW family protein [Patescibacteria group bacterium]
MPVPRLSGKKFRVKKTIWPLTVSLGLICLILLGFSLYGLEYYRHRFYPHTLIGNLDLSGLTPAEASELIQNHWNQLVSKGWTFEALGQSMVIHQVGGMAEGAPLLFSLDIEDTLNKAWGGQHHNHPTIASFIADYFAKHQTTASVMINELLVRQQLEANFQPLITPSKPATIEVQPDGSYQIKPEIIGESIDYEAGISEFKKQLQNLKNEPIILTVKPDQPTITQSAIGDLTGPINQYLTLAPITLQLATTTWTINRNTLAKWLTLELVDNQITASISSSSVKDYLTKLAPEINQEPQGGQFKRNGNRLEQFKPGKNGRELNIEVSTNAIIQALKQGINNIELTVNDIPSPLSDTDPASLGIIEIIGIGTSDFSGSPPNRIHNIKVGTAKVSGQLVAPGEEFSLVKALGEVSAATGYKPELVIKENKTVPEYGGGLCQVATTIFRAALASGLPITERQNHSYRVSYYEPAGTDATVYSPKPDLRFINDTGHYILLLGEVSGHTLSFTVWGTKDGRKIIQTKPVIYNIVKPAPRKLIETEDLEPGKLKCIEQAHNGADTYFDYIVTYPNGETKSKRFQSHYVPWQEVCLIGKEKGEESQTTTPSLVSSTDSIFTSTTGNIATTSATTTN